MVQVLRERRVGVEALEGEEGSKTASSERWELGFFDKVLRLRDGSDERDYDL